MVKAKLFKVASPLLALALVLSLMAVVAVPQPVSAASSTGTSNITGNPTSTITITAPSNITNTAWSIGTNNMQPSTNLTVSSNDVWQVSVNDTLCESKPSGTAGKLVSYNTTSNTYEASGPALTNALGVKVTGQSVVTLSGTAQNLYGSSQSAGVTNQNCGTLFNQTITYADVVQATGHTYRIVITFVGTCPV